MKTITWNKILKQCNRFINLHGKCFNCGQTTDNYDALAGWWCEDCIKIWQENEYIKAIS